MDRQTFSDVMLASRRIASCDKLAAEIEQLHGRRILVDLSGRRGLAAASDRTERLALGAFHLGRIGTAAPLQVKVLSNRVVKKTHSVKGYSPGDTLAISGSALTVRFWRSRCARDRAPPSGSVKSFP